MSTHPRTRILFFFSRLTIAILSFQLSSLSYTVAEETEKLSVAVSLLPKKIPLPDLAQNSESQKDLVTTILLRNVAPGLARRHGTSEIRPLLAKSVRSEKSGSKLLFEVPQTTHALDGRVLDAEMLAENLRTTQLRNLKKPSVALDPNLKSSKQLSPEFKTPEFKIEVVNSDPLSNLNQEILIEFDPTDQGQFSKLASLLEHPILDKQLSQMFGRRLGESTLIPGYGFYELASIGSNKLELVPRKGSNRSAAFKKIEFIKIPDQHEQLKALRTGSVDMLLLPSQSLLEQAAKDSTLQIVELDSKAFAEPAPVENPVGRAQKASLTTEKYSVILRKGIEVSQNFDGCFTIPQISRKY